MVWDVGLERVERVERGGCALYWLWGVVHYRSSEQTTEHRGAKDGMLMLCSPGQQYY